MVRKTVVITGASRGIGKACAFAFAKRDCNLIITNSKDTDSIRAVAADLREITGGFVHTFTGDLGDPDRVRRLFGEIAVSVGGADILVNNAGISITGLINKTSDEDWNRILSSNLSSAFYCCRSAVPYMVKQKSGRIINVSSVWGVHGASCEVAYSATKAGINGLTKALAKELAPSKIAVNAIAFGCVDTDMNACYSEEERKVLEEEISASYFLSPEEAGEAIAKLSEMPDYLTGQIITMDGGWI